MAIKFPYTAQVLLSLGVQYPKIIYIQNLALATYLFKISDIQGTGTSWTKCNCVKLDCNTRNIFYKKQVIFLPRRVFLIFSKFHLGLFLVNKKRENFLWFFCDFSWFFVIFRQKSPKIWPNVSYKVYKCLGLFLIFSCFFNWPRPFLIKVFLINNIACRSNYAK